MTTAQLAAQFGYTESYFCQLFRTVTDYSPVQYIKYLHLEKARKILKRDASIKIAEVAHQCGFDDPNYFARCFKAQYQISATKYQKSKQ